MVTGESKLIHLEIDGEKYECFVNQKDELTFQESNYDHLSGGVCVSFSLEDLEAMIELLKSESNG